MPALKRRLDTIESLDPETRDKIDATGMKRTVRAFNPRQKDRSPCHVWGQHSYVSQAHHLIEVGKVAGVLRAMAIYDWTPTIPTVPLCPNHHAYEHAMARCKKREDVPPELLSDLSRELSEREWDRLIETHDMRTEAQNHMWRQVRGSS